MKIIGVIPSRYASSRFPGKPLSDICGKPMVWWVYNQAKCVKELDEVIVATEDERITDVCKKYGIPSIMTSDKHKNGTERLAEVAAKIEADLYVTIQGDEPLTQPGDISKLIHFALSTDAPCATMKTAYKNPVDVINSTTPKVVSDLNDNILLFTRLPVPYPKAALDYIIWKPIGIYIFKRDILLKYPQLKMGPLERAEEIELLRFIEHGFNVKIVETESNTIAVDTEKDLKRVVDMAKNLCSGDPESYFKLRQSE